MTTNVIKFAHQWLDKNGDLLVGKLPTNKVNRINKIK